MNVKNSFFIGNCEDNDSDERQNKDVDDDERRWRSRYNGEPSRVYTWEYICIKGLLRRVSSFRRYMETRKS